MTLDRAAGNLLLAHHALGRMTICTSAADFAEVAAELLAAARDAARELEPLRTRIPEQLAAVLKHPLESELRRVSPGKPPAVYVSRLARGSGPPPVRQGNSIVHLIVANKLCPDDFFFEGLDNRPAIELCAEYLERVTAALDACRATAAQSRGNSRRP